ARESFALYLPLPPLHSLRLSSLACRARSIVMHSTGALDRVLAAAECGVTVLTANTRAARQLRLAYDRRQSDRGLRAWRSPDVIAWPGFVGPLWRQLLW